MDDKQIIDMFLSRDENAITAISQKYKNYCYKIVYNILGNRQDTEECLNDSYLKVWNSIPPTIPERLSVFLGKIARHTALNLFEKNSAKKRGGNVSTVSDEFFQCFSGVDEWNNMTHNIHIKELLNSFLENLSQEKRIVFLQRYWYICSIEKISLEHGYSKSKTKMMLSRIREELKNFLEKEGVEL